MSKVIIIGWDGATFDIINPLVAAGRLPNVAYLMKNGVWGRMESTIPPLTPTAWTSLITGVNPGKHAIFDAMLYSPGARKMSFVNASMRKSKPVWSILSEAGRKVGVLNVPVTYPPDEVDGFVIPGMFTPEGADNFTYPGGLKDDLMRTFGHYFIECNYSSSPSSYLKSIRSVDVDFREKVASYLMGKYDWDFFFCVFMSSDRVQHFFWKYLDPSHPEHGRYGDAIASVYQAMDEALGRLIGESGSDTSVIMVSDHGSGPLKKAFFLNYWLLKNNYLFLERDFADVYKKTSRVWPRIAGTVKKGIRSFTSGRVGSGVTQSQRDALNLFPSQIDWDRTIAFSEGVGGGVYINPLKVGPEDYALTVEKIRNGLLDLRDDLGQRVVSAVHRREEIYHGDFTALAPDLIVLCESGYQVIAPNELLLFGKEFENRLFLTHRWSGRHEHDGIFIMKGPAVKKNMEINGCRIIDVAPTVLYLMGEEVPRYMDGRVLEVSIKDSFLEGNPVRFSSGADAQEPQRVSLSEDEDRKISERLRDLGYIE